MKVSILIPAFNAADTLRATLLSCVKQGVAVVDEIIVVDDHSTDNTHSIFKVVQGQHPHFRWVWATNPKKGACSARNHALELSRGEWIQWLDADDILGPKKLATQLETLRKHPSSIATCPFRPFQGDPNSGRLEDPRNWNLQAKWNPADWIATDPMCIPACWLGSKALMMEVGPWDESLRVNQDGEFFCRVIAQSDALFFEDSIQVFYRREGEGVSRFTPEKADSLWRSIESMEATALGLEDSERMRQMVSNRAQHFIYTVYPHAKDLRGKAKLKVANLPPPTIVNPNAVSSLSRFIQTLFGWKALTIFRIIRGLIR